MKSLVLGIIVAGIMVAPVWAETVTGIIDVKDFGKVQSKWKFRLADTSEKFDKEYRKSKRVRSHEKTSKLDRSEGTLKVKGSSAEVGESRTEREKHVTWGAFFWCVNSEKLPKVRFAYTYGERTEDLAWQKAEFAFHAMEGRCNEKGVKKQVLCSDDL
ncbi:MAG: hypothetical protein HY913_03400 [Desulfomonile tiedjei]|nr:hypothetical protein [Desulfomonile tiedjei]